MNICLPLKKSARHRSADSELTDDGKLAEDMVMVRSGGESVRMPSDKVTHMDVSPRQVVSVAASLIPFWNMTMPTVP